MEEGEGVNGQGKSKGGGVNVTDGRERGGGGGGREGGGIVLRGKRGQGRVMTRGKGPILREGVRAGIIILRRIVWIACVY